VTDCIGCLSAQVGDSALNNIIVDGVGAFADPVIHFGNRAKID
jgi:hypothetical protein